VLSQLGTGITVTDSSHDVLNTGNRPHGQADPQHSALSNQHSESGTPDFVVVGNVVRDVTPDGWVAGGTAVYACAVALGLGRRVGVVTAAPADVVAAGLPPDAAVARAGVTAATSYENVYTPEGRVQYLRAAGEPVPPETLPEAWTHARAVLLGPVYHEVGTALAGRFSSRVGLCAQGFLRRAGPDGRVSPLPPREWDAAPLLRRVSVLFLSDEDLRAGSGVPPAWLDAVPLTVLTAGRHGARVYSRGRWWRVAAHPAREVDPTGAGDSFAAAFLVALDEGAEPVEAARFAAVVASFTIEGVGPQSPTREQVELRRRGLESALGGAASSPGGPRVAP
jgi:sugar/nucleoside kinase (ribokinase family)